MQRRIEDLILRFADHIGDDSIASALLFAGVALVIGLTATAIYLAI